ncbi:mitochondrial protein C2orf69 homolog [Halictus rubicundus]|uniref:mitochondrial protein C2orf69 homolog n=1 Tax=Halictus rubicundus TaxID=77578 RepID=UPI0040370939
MSVFEMSSKICIWKKVPGIASRFNDIIYSHPKSLPCQDILVYFGGDVQDIEECMERHADSKKYTEWSLENTAQILSTNFPNKHVLVIRPSRIHDTGNASFSCYDNFVPSNEYGVPSFLPTFNALQHLQRLIISSLQDLKIHKDENLTHLINDKTKLTLMGFSKGSVVLNQFLHEFHYHLNNSDPDQEITNFIKFIESMWWLDSGHGGTRDTWITNKPILESFAKLKIDVHVHVTPYQVCDRHRPWIREEENQFCSILQSMEVPVKRIFHFSCEPRSLTLHFHVLKAIVKYM